MGRFVGAETPRCLLELALAARPVPAAGMQPGDRDVDEPLEEVALGSRGLAPLVLQLLVRLEVVAGADEVEASFEPHAGIIGVRERC